MREKSEERKGGRQNKITRRIMNLTEPSLLIGGKMEEKKRKKKKGKTREKKIMT